MKNINKISTLILTVAIGVLLIPAFFAAWAEDESTSDSDMFLAILSKLFYILRFPTHVLFWKVFSCNMKMFLVGLILNCLFFGLLIERVIYFSKQIKPKLN